MIANKKKFDSYLIKPLKVSIAILTVVVIIAINWFIFQEKKLHNRIYPHVYIGNINFGGKTRQEIIDFYNQKNKKLDSFYLTIVYDQEPIATYSAHTLKIAYDGEGMADRAYLIGRSSHLPSRLYQKMAVLFGKTRFELNPLLNWDKDIVVDFISNCEEKYNRPAKNALFQFIDGKVKSFRQEEKGIKIDSEKFMDDVSLALNQPDDSGAKTIILTSRTIDPEITLNKANSFGIEEFIAEGKSDFSHSIPERVHNIIIASSKFNGILIPTNKVFSFNETVGDISPLTGYKQAYIIKEGKTVLGDGGGVCQVSTTFFRAALNAGLPIVERHAHAYRVSYYENDAKPGFDATVYDPTADLKIKNDTPAYILIQTEVDQNNNILYFRFYGKKDNRTMEISPVILSDVQPPPPPLYQDDPTLKKGVVKQIDFAAWGGKANFSYKVSKDGKTIFEKTFFSSYRPWQAVFLRGTAD